MSKVDAYICNYANHLIPLSETVGIVPVEDLFDKQLSFPAVFTEAKIRKTDVHFCQDCWKKVVLIPAGNMIDRKKKMGVGELLSKEREYELKIKELAYGFRSQCIQNHRNKNRGKKS